MGRQTTLRKHLQKTFFVKTYLLIMSKIFDNFDHDENDYNIQRRRKSEYTKRFALLEVYQLESS